MQDFGIFDQIVDSIETLIPTIINFVNNTTIFKFIKKHKSIIKLILMILISFRVFYRIQILNIKEESVNLHYKLIGNVVNIVILVYTIISESRRKK
jgi:hypothetical protein